MSRLFTLTALGAALIAALAIQRIQQNEATPALPGPSPQHGPATTTRRPTPSRDQGQPIEPYEPDATEPYVNGKRLAGRVAARLVTYGEGESSTRLARSIAASGMRAAVLARVMKPLMPPGTSSSGEVVYVQLSGVTATTLGAMAVVRQQLTDEDGLRSVVTRTIDVQLRRVDGPWSLDRIGSIGGRPMDRPERISSAARRLLDHPNVMLPDTARWDIYSGLVDDELMRRLAEIADRRRIAISVLRTGHPPTVWGTDRRSAHASGLAADIWSVGGRLVLEQRAAGTPAHDVATEFVAGGAAEVGSPWVLSPAGDRSFTDAVHQDHLHVQQRELPPVAMNTEPAGSEQPMG